MGINLENKKIEKETFAPEQTEAQEAKKQLEQLEKEKYILNTDYGEIVFNTKYQATGRLTNLSLARYDGIVNYKPYAIRKIICSISFKNKSASSINLPYGEVVNDKTWILDREKCPKEVTLTSIFRALGCSLEQEPDKPIELFSYQLKQFPTRNQLFRPQNTLFFCGLKLDDPGVIKIKKGTTLQGQLKSGNAKIVEASLSLADDFIQGGNLRNLKKYYESWQELKSAHDATYHDIRYREVEASDGWGMETERYFFPDVFEYLIFKDKNNVEAIKKELLLKSFRAWLANKRKKFGSDFEQFEWVGNIRVDSKKNNLWIAGKNLPDQAKNTPNPITFEQFTKICADYLFN